jgi:hypothetical protein
VQLRLLAGVFRIVLTGRAGGLTRHYPCLGGTAPAAEAWPVLHRVIADHVTELRGALQIAPQTNEVGRSAALLVGMSDVLGQAGLNRVRLLELGASGGLNLLLDRFAIHGDGWRFGPPDSPVQLLDAVQGPVELRNPVIVERGGCDLHPVDAGSAEGRLLLTSFVWPFDVHRHDRLRRAFTVVDEVGAVRVDKASASDWREHQLARPTDPDVLPLIWNSITQQYWPADEVARVQELLEQTGAQRPLARVTMEFRPDVPAYEPPEVRTVYWYGDGTPPVRRLIGSAHDHGVPVQLSAP